MVESKAFQIKVIERMLLKYGLEADLVDLTALVDSNLSLEENARIIREEYGLVDRTRGETKSVKKLDNFLKAVEAFNRLSVSRQRMDASKQARKVFQRSELSDSNFDKWSNNKNRFDVEGVDSKYG